jgi:hypothetical protein
MSNNQENPPGQATSPGLLPVTYQDLQKSGEVEWAVQRSPEPVPNDPHQRVATYLGSLVGRHGLLGGSEERRQAQVAHHVMDPEDIPESYFDRQREIARQQGHGDIEIDHEMRQQHAEALIADQTASLNAWVEYLDHPDADYPAWFRYYTMRNVLKLADYDKEKGKFRTRSKKTTAPYPELNREALAYVYERLNRRLEGQEQNDEQIQELAQQANFNKLYSHALAESVPSDPEKPQSTAGEWTTYQQLDPKEGADRARQLAESLQGYGTGWCTAGEGLAEGHLRGGDFHVYYSYDREGQPTVPRVAVRMHNGKVAEVRGIETGENLEPAMTDITMERVKDLPGSQEYLQAAEDMNRVTDIEIRVRQGQELTARDIYFLREYSGQIQNFGYGKDPRIGELLQDRDPSADMDIMLENFDHAQLVQNLLESGLSGQNTLVDNLDKLLQSETLDQTQLARELMLRAMDCTLAQNLDKFLQSEAVDHAELAWELMATGMEHILANNLEKFPDGAVDHAQLARYLLKSGPAAQNTLAQNLDKFPPGAVDHVKFARDLMKNGREHILADNLDKFPPEAVNHSKLARKLMRNTYDMETLAQNLDKFPSDAVDHAELARALMKNGRKEILPQNLDKFPPGAVDHVKLARDMVDGSMIERVKLAKNLEKFQPGAVDHAQLVRGMMDDGREDVLIDNLHKFPLEAVNHAQLARDLVDGERENLVAYNLDKFQELPADVRDQLPRPGNA